MPNNVVTAPPEIADEINRGLAVLQKKEGYEAKVVDGPDADQFSILFTFGEASQTMKFKRSDAKKKGTIEKQVVDRLNI